VYLVSRSQRVRLRLARLGLMERLPAERLLADRTAALRAAVESEAESGR
jgi:hypothetical protein